MMVKKYGSMVNTLDSSNFGATVGIHLEEPNSSSVHADAGKSSQYRHDTSSHGDEQQNAEFLESTPTVVETTAY